MREKGRREKGRRGKGEDVYVPKHDQNVRDMVHPTLMHGLDLFVRGGHEEQAIPVIQVSKPHMAASN